MNVLVLMKALPPTKGHEAMIRFASHFGKVHVLMDHHPDEPDVLDRREALSYAAPFVHVIAREVIPQVPEDDPNFWALWSEILDSVSDNAGGFDYVVGSEDYCKRIADMVDARYIPFDPNRVYCYTKATEVRGEPVKNFDQMMDYFQQLYRTTVTVFGAESTGKTTLSRHMANRLNAPWLYEYARPYLESVGAEINTRKMTEIWKGQRALQIIARQQEQNSPWIIQDTDLYTTVGYWEQPHWKDSLGPVPDQLLRDAKHEKSDLYIITLSNIPFEQDPLRYGGDRRESSDEYWIGVAKKYDLNYVVLESPEQASRLTKALWLARMAAQDKTGPLRYERIGND